MFKIIYFSSVRLTAPWLTDVSERWAPHLSDSIKSPDFNFNYLFSIFQTNLLCECDDVVVWRHIAMVNRMLVEKRFIFHWNYRSTKRYRFAIKTAKFVRTVHFMCCVSCFDSVRIASRTQSNNSIAKRRQWMCWYLSLYTLNFNAFDE